MDVYVAQVTKTGLGDSGRSIKVKSSMIPELPELIEPAFLGDIQLPPPTVDELVLVFNLDISNTNRLYLPIRANLGELDSNGENKDSGKLQIENSTGDIELEGSNIVLGNAATNAGVMWEPLETLLGTLVTLISTDVHPTAVGPSGPSVNSTTIKNLDLQFENFKSAIVKLK